MKCMRPFVLIADIAFTEIRFPVRRTIGVRPRSPQVRPLTWSERMPTWSAKRTSPPSAFAFARIAGQVSSSQTRTASGSCSIAPLVGPLERQPPPLEVPAHPRLGQPHPVQLRDQYADLATRPQLPG